MLVDASHKSVIFFSSATRHTICKYFAFNDVRLARGAHNAMMARGCGGGSGGLTGLTASLGYSLMSAFA